MSWTTASDLINQIERLWNNGRILSSIASGAAMFPLRLKLRKPDSKALAAKFGDVQDWIRALDDASKAKRGFGYDIVWVDVDHRQLGRNRVPSEIHVTTEMDALRLIGKQRAAEQFRDLLRATNAAFPALQPWLERRPLTAVENADDWPRILSVLAWFRDHPRSDLYLRQLDIPGIDTKFIERRKGLLSELITLSTSPSGVESASAAGFEQRHGLRTKPALVRFRILDSTLAIAGCTDLTIPATEFAALRISPARVFITENEVNGLAFPDVPGGLVIFGLGYSVALLSNAPWLKSQRVQYWGDIDTHGFAMLSRLRRMLPHAETLLMDRHTLLAHRELWVSEASPHLSDLTLLSDDERSLYDDLRYNRLGDGVRLEQERIPFSKVTAALEARI